MTTPIEVKQRDDRSGRQVQPRRVEIGEVELEERDRVRVVEERALRRQVARLLRGIADVAVHALADDQPPSTTITGVRMAGRRAASSSPSGMLSGSAKPPRYGYDDRPKASMKGKSA